MVDEKRQKILKEPKAKKNMGAYGNSAELYISMCEKIIQQSKI